MQRYEDGLNAHRSHPFEQFVGEVQTCGGSRGAAFLAGINGLIAFGVGKRLGDVWRQGHFADIVQAFLPVEANNALAFRFDFQHLAAHRTAFARNLECGTGTQKPSGASDGAPYAGRYAR